MVGVKELNKSIKSTIRKNLKIDIDCEFSNNFAWLYEEDIITYTLLEADQSKRTFDNFLTNHGAEIVDDIDSFVYSLLHEVGHYHTYFNMPLIKRMISRFFERIIQFIIFHTPENDFIYSLYYYLPHEKIASVWAIKHAPEVKKQMRKDIAKALLKFYQKIYA